MRLRLRSRASRNASCSCALLALLAFVACGRVNYRTVDAARADALSGFDVMSSIDAPQDSTSASADGGLDAAADTTSSVATDGAIAEAASMDAAEAAVVADVGPDVALAADLPPPGFDAEAACARNPIRHDEILNGGVFVLCNSTQIVSLALSPGDWNSSYEVAQDIDLDSRAFPSIGNAAFPFSGTFFGGNHEITGFRMTSLDPNVGFFGVVSGFIVGFQLTGSVTPIGASQNVGIVVGQLTGRAEGIVVIGNVIRSGNVATAGGFAGSVDGVTAEVEGVASVANVDAAGSGSVGGVIGQITGGSLTNSFVGPVVVNGGQFTGGFVGVTVNATLAGLQAMGGGVQVTSQNHAGGIVGVAQMSNIRDARVTISTVRSSNLPSVPFLGGACGQSIQSTFHQIMVTGGVVTNGQLVGGLIGHAFDSTVTECTTDISVIGVGRAGGISGEMQNGSLRDSYAKGSVTSMGSAGGLVGNMTSAAIIERSYASGVVTGPFAVGGLVGDFTGGSIVSSFATGAVTSCGLWCGGLTGGHMGPVDATIMSSYWSTSSSGYSVMCGVTAGVVTCNDTNGIATAGYFLTASNAPMNGWDFTTVWASPAGVLPRLRFE